MTVRFIHIDYSKSDIIRLIRFNYSCIYYKRHNLLVMPLWF